MGILSSLQPQRVFAHFEALSAVPRGSQHTARIAEFCMDFAKAHGLDAVRDNADNVIIRKPATVGYEAAQAVMLQGHLDMVWQKAEDCDIDFMNEGLRLRVDGDFVSADGTTLGADNGIAAAMILAILESDDIPHPALEVVFTSDEEIGMIGARELDMSLLKARRMINLDAEEDDTLTVSCAGGSDLCMTFPIKRTQKDGTAVTVCFKGLRGGHSGVEIHRGRVNADMLAGRFLHQMRHTAFSVINVSGGDKPNAIPNACSMTLCVSDPKGFAEHAKACLDMIAAEIAARDPQFVYTVEAGENGTFDVLDPAAEKALLAALLLSPNGVMDMSAEIDGLVETSLNLGILSTDNNQVLLHFALRSNKRTAMSFLEQKLTALAKQLGFSVDTFGHYPPWEFKNDSTLQELYKTCYKAQYGKDPKVEAIHAGLECGVFASQLEGLDCIAIGPTLCDVHTVNEKLSISSTQNTYQLLLSILKNCQNA